VDYTLELTTIEGMADSDYLDRLADLVYDLPDLIDPLLALNDDGSVSASFCVVGHDPFQAAESALTSFLAAAVEAKPLRLPTEGEAELHDRTLAAGLGATVGSFAVTPAHDRERVFA
jgi:hypothetical protein